MSSLRRPDILEKQPQIEQWIEEHQSKAFICKQLNCKQDTLNKYLEYMGITYEGNQSGKGFTKSNGRKMDLATYRATSKDIQSNKVRKKILEEGIKEYRCECCGLTEWLGNPIPLELHHKDGDKTHNEINNYELLCPNCHAFTDSYRGKNCRKE